MPLYSFKNPETGEVIDILQKMNDPHVYIDKTGVKYERVYISPNMSIDSNINAFSSKDFVEKTKNKKGTIGDLFDKSRELSEKRGGQESDPVLKKYYDSYSRDNGVKHANQISQENKAKANNNLKKIGISID
jgi:predicted nucleic acid-binding Zn ribbon protein